jgi:hypothetical protein
MFLNQLRASFLYTTSFTQIQCEKSFSESNYRMLTGQFDILVRKNPIDFKLLTRATVRKILFRVKLQDADRSLLLNTRLYVTRRNKVNCNVPRIRN